MVYGEDVSKIIDRRIDDFLADWGISATRNGYRYIKEVAVCMVRNPSLAPYSAMQEVAKMYGVARTTITMAIQKSLEGCTPPRSTFYINNKPKIKEFMFLCVNTVLMEK